jgi:hypothetical protein
LNWIAHFLAESRMPCVRVACFVLGLGWPITAIAQETPPPVEIFVGYSRLPAGSEDFPRQTSHGVQGSVSVNVNRWFGVVGDMGVQWSTARNLGPNFSGLVARTVVQEYLIGPRFVRRSSAIDLFAHGLVGQVAGDAGDDFAGFSDTEIAFGGGGGVDLRIGSRIAVRAQFDLIGSFTDIVEGNSRLALGAVFGIGPFRE